MPKLGITDFEDMKVRTLHCWELFQTTIEKYLLIHPFDLGLIILSCLVPKYPFGTGYSPVWSRTKDYNNGLINGELLINHQLYMIG